MHRATRQLNCSSWELLDSVKNIHIFLAKTLYRFKRKTTPHDNLAPFSPLLSEVVGASESIRSVDKI